MLIFTLKIEKNVCYNTPLSTKVCDSSLYEWQKNVHKSKTPEYQGA